MIRFVCCLISVFMSATLLSGCQHHVTHVAAIPPPAPDAVPQMVSVPPPSHPSEPVSTPPAVVATVAPATLPAEPVRKPRRPRKITASAPANSTTPPQPTSQSTVGSSVPATSSVAAVSTTPAAPSAPTSSDGQGPIAQAPATQVAAATPPPAPGTIGQLSTGGESTGQDLQQANELVHAQEARLNSLSSATASEHKTEVDKVKHFLVQAEEALKSSDAEGARTLAVKAKVLLDELQK